eukprot:Nitzschia sp. Nitz4//scaffold77_size91520//25663//26751//NITZ4_004884-RA/size91520-processed-gene-0.28-mRNA-1//1//CDS//3329557973//5050//frame0
MVDDSLPELVSESDTASLQATVDRFAKENQSLREDNEDLSTQNQAYLVKITELQAQVVKQPSGMPMPRVVENDDSAESLQSVISDLQIRIGILIQEKCQLQTTIESLEHQLSNGIAEPQAPPAPSNPAATNPAPPKKSGRWLQGFLSSRTTSATNEDPAVSVENEDDSAIGSVQSPTHESLSVQEDSFANSPPKTTPTVSPDSIGEQAGTKDDSTLQQVGSTTKAAESTEVSSQATRRPGWFNGFRASRIKSTTPEPQVEALVSPVEATDFATPTSSFSPKEDSFLNSPKGYPEDQEEPNKENRQQSSPLQLDGGKETTILTLSTEQRRENENDRDYWKRMKQDDVSSMFEVAALPADDSAN